MPATFLLIPAAVIITLACILAWWHTRSPASHGPDDELVRLRSQAAWLEQRLDTARRERWDRDMIHSLSDQLGAACQRLARAERDLHRPLVMSGPNSPPA